jgi:hypothetical protein
MTHERHDDERTRLQGFKDAGLIHDFQIREHDVLVTLRAPLRSFEASTDAAKRIITHSNRVVAPEGENP